jgi:enoyl-CoA hydratase/carnithine racemase
LNRPDRLNALNDQLAEDLADAIAEIRQDDSTRVVVLRGAGRAFCAGLDLNERQPGTPLSLGRTSGLGRLAEIVIGLHEAPQAIVALVNGPACGGGFAFMLAADIRIASVSARFNAAFVNLGLTGCELGSSYFLPRSVGTSIASELILTGRFLSAQRALSCGFVSDVVDEDQLVPAGEALVSDLLRISPAGLRVGKETMRRTLPLHDLGEVIRIEARAQARCADDPHAAEAMRAFLERREPNYD